MPPPKSVFTSHERNALKDRWGSQATRLTRDSFLPFGSCQLCLLPSVDPVCCPQGDLFCRECAMSNLLAQRKEMKRLEKLNERLKLEDEDQKVHEEEEARLRAIEDFEAVQMGLSVKAGASARVIGRQDGKILVEQDQEHEQDSEHHNNLEGKPKGTKRKFEIDEEELTRIATSDRNKAKQTLTSERKAAKPHLPSFWIPTETPSQHHKPASTKKRTPTCPSSTPTNPHPLSLKSLTTIHFHTEPPQKQSQSSPTPNPPSCPSCQKTLSNSTKATVAIPCGHVLCNPCVQNFILKPELRHHRDAHERVARAGADAGADAEAGAMHCYVCDADLTAGLGAGEDDGKKKRKKGEKEKEGVRHGLVELRSEGTGFASGGAAVVRRDGVAFQIG
ncbi:hypothetical protein J1614_008271 [Plenodomus biglobosus]|nr:hypothetical protein J1614_008271 [Plenodomus biglobosus]